MSTLFKLFLLTIFFFLSSCATFTHNNPTNDGPKENLSWNEREQRLKRIGGWQIKGKIGVQTAQNSGSANVDWWQNRGYYRISLYGPLGAGAMKLEGGPGRVMLQTSKGERLRAGSAEELLAKYWGYRLPFSHLNYWIRGVPVPDIEQRSEFDSQHRIVRLQQEGWIIQYLNYSYTAGTYLPDRIAISSPSLRAKIIIYQWNIT